MGTGLREKYNASLSMRPAVQSDLDAVVGVHLAAFHSGSTLSALGSAFLRPPFSALSIRRLHAHLMRIACIRIFRL